MILHALGRHPPEVIVRGTEEEIQRLAGLVGVGDEVEVIRAGTNAQDVRKVLDELAERFRDEAKGEERTRAYLDNRGDVRGAESCRRADRTYTRAARIVAEYLARLST